MNFTSGFPLFFQVHTSLWQWGSPAHQLSVLSLCLIFIIKDVWETRSLICCANLATFLMDLSMFVVIQALETQATAPLHLTPCLITERLSMIQ